MLCSCPLSVSVIQVALLLTAGKTQCRGSSLWTCTVTGSFMLPVWQELEKRAQTSQEEALVSKHLLFYRVKTHLLCSIRGHTGVCQGSRQRQALWKSAGEKGEALKLWRLAACTCSAVRAALLQGVTTNYSVGPGPATTTRSQPGRGVWLIVEAIVSWIGIAFMTPMVLCCRAFPSAALLLQAGVCVCNTCSRRTSTLPLHLEHDAM